MRLDIYLKLSRIVLRRTLANELSDAGLVKVNKISAKPAREVKIGDEIEVKRANRITKIKILRVPESKQVSKQDAANLYEIISEEIVEDLF